MDSKESLEQIARNNELTLIDSSVIIFGGGKERKKDVLSHIYDKATAPTKIDKGLLNEAIDHALFINQLIGNYSLATTPIVVREIYEGIVKLRQWIDYTTKNKKYKKAREQFALLGRIANLNEELLENIKRIKPPQELKRSIKLIGSQFGLRGSEADYEMVAAALYEGLRNRVALVSNDGLFEPLLKNLYKYLVYGLKLPQYEKEIRLYSRLNKEGIYKEVLNTKKLRGLMVNPIGEELKRYIQKILFA